MKSAGAGHIAVQSSIPSELIADILSDTVRLRSTSGTDLVHLWFAFGTVLGHVPRQGDELPAQFIARISLKAAHTVSMNLGQDRLAATNWMPRRARLWMPRHGGLVS